MNKTVKYTWLGISLFGILVGLAMVIWPSTSLKVICYITGITAILFGVLQFVLQWRIDSKEAFSGRYLLAILLVIAGILLLIRTVAVLMLFLGALVLIDSLFKFRLAFLMKRERVSNWKTIMIISAISTLAGILMLFVPGSTAEWLAILIGIGVMLNCAINIWVYLISQKLSSGPSFIVK